MAFDYPSVATEKKLAKKKAKKDKEIKVTEKDFEKITKPVYNKKGPKGEIAFDQLDAALSAKNIGDGKKITKKGLKNIVDAAADDKQLTRTKRSILRNYKSGGRAGYKGGGMSQRGLGRAFMKGGKV
jgi:hypothetical protein|tara:strand:- start:168 stop:548 length:381 start_codon:yes stop_codon:yes gene_type:complete